MSPSFLSHKIFKIRISIQIHNKPAESSTLYLHNDTQSTMSYKNSDLANRLHALCSKYKGELDLQTLNSRIEVMNLVLPYPLISPSDQQDRISPNFDQLNDLGREVEATRAGIDADILAYTKASCLELTTAVIRLPRELREIIYDEFINGLDGGKDDIIECVKDKAEPNREHEKEPKREVPLLDFDLGHPQFMAELVQIAMKAAGRARDILSPSNPHQVPGILESDPFNSGFRTGTLYRRAIMAFSLAKSREDFVNFDESCSIWDPQLVETIQSDLQRLSSETCSSLSMIFHTKGFTALELANLFEKCIESLQSVHDRGIEVYFLYMREADIEDYDDGPEVLFSIEDNKEDIKCRNMKGVSFSSRDERPRSFERFQSWKDRYLSGIREDDSDKVHEINRQSQLFKSISSYNFEISQTIFTNIPKAFVIMLSLPKPYNNPDLAAPLRRALNDVLKSQEEIRQEIMESILPFPLTGPSDQYDRFPPSTDLLRSRRERFRAVNAELDADILRHAQTSCKQFTEEIQGRLPPELLLMIFRTFIELCSTRYIDGARHVLEHLREQVNPPPPTRKPYFAQGGDIRRLVRLFDDQFMDSNFLTEWVREVLKMPRRWLREDYYEVLLPYDPRDINRIRRNELLRTGVTADELYDAIGIMAYIFTTNRVNRPSFEHFCFRYSPRVIREIESTLLQLDPKNNPYVVGCFRMHGFPNQWMSRVFNYMIPTWQHLLYQGFRTPVFRIIGEDNNAHFEFISYNTHSMFMCRGLEGRNSIQFGVSAEFTEGLFLFRKWEEDYFASD
ncbi:unnamed protein product [Periconia digitata]|uniref:Uncharacterized protein n=1 Tax=Periconia digitata TaxID=1303443 RepID=A0A9W4XPP1_9PLEO|nr:unnamed protein product [Periconia digitata]